MTTAREWMSYATPVEFGSKPWGYIGPVTLETENISRAEKQKR